MRNKFTKMAFSTLIAFSLASCSTSELISVLVPVVENLVSEDIKSAEEIISSVVEEQSQDTGTSQDIKSDGGSSEQVQQSEEKSEQVQQSEEKSEQVSEQVSEQDSEAVSEEVSSQEVESSEEVSSEEDPYEWRRNWDDDNHWYETYVYEDGAWKGLIKDVEPHNWVVNYVYPPLDYREGWTEYKCTGCGWMKQDDYVPPLMGEHEHVYDDTWKYDSNYHYHACTICGGGVEFEDLQEHDIVETVVPPTATEYGYTKHACSVCGYYWIDEIVEATYKYYDYTIGYETFSKVDTKYATGNYGYLRPEGTYATHEYYRAIGATEERPYLTLKDANYMYGDGGLPGYFMGTDDNGACGIREVRITYKSDFGGRLYYGMTRVDSKELELDNKMKYIIMEPQSEFTEVTFVIPADEHPVFSKITTNGGDLYIKQITYASERFHVDYDISNYFTRVTDYREKAPAPILNPVDGESKMTLTGADGNPKEYTYYSSQYVMNNLNSLNLEDVVYYTPVDVSNYYLAFRAFPANYVYKDEINTYKDVFGNYLRQVSYYTRTDGYMTPLPYNNYLDNAFPKYYELDIDLDGTYSVYNRGVGRVVVVAAGFSCYDYGLNPYGIPASDPVMLFTDDHYISFFEYKNDGAFNLRFSESNYVCGIIHSPLISNPDHMYNAYTVEFIDGDSVLASEYFQEGTLISSRLLKNWYNPQRTGDSFLGWYLDPECTILLDDYLVYSKTTLYAKWANGGQGEIIDPNNPDNPDNPPLDSDPNVTDYSRTAISVAEAKQIIDEANGKPEGLYYVRGTVSTQPVKGKGDTYKFDLENGFQLYYGGTSGLGMPEIGDEVIIAGELVLYNNRVYETKSGTGSLIQNITKQEYRKLFFLRNMPEIQLYDNNFHCGFVAYSASFPEGYAQYKLVDSDTDQFFSATSFVTGFKYCIFDGSLENVVYETPLINIEGYKNEYNFPGFATGTFAERRNESDTDWYEKLLDGDYSGCSVGPMLMEAGKNYEDLIMQKANDQFAFADCEGNVSDKFTISDDGYYCMSYSYESQEFAIEFLDSAKLAGYYFNNFAYFSDSALEARLLDEFDIVEYPTLKAHKYIELKYGADEVEELIALFVECGYTAWADVTTSGQVAYVNDNTQTALVLLETGELRYSSLADAEWNYGEYVNYSTIAVTGVDPEYAYWLWVWSGNYQGHFVEGQYVNGKYEFVIPTSTDGFSVVKFAAGTTEGNWDNKIAQTDNITFDTSIGEYEANI